MRKGVPDCSIAAQEPTRSPIRFPSPKPRSEPRKSSVEKSQETSKEHLRKQRSSRRSSPSRRGSQSPRKTWSRETPLSQRWRRSRSPRNPEPQKRRASPDRKDGNKRRYGSTPSQRRHQSPKELSRRVEYPSLVPRVRVEAERHGLCHPRRQEKSANVGSDHLKPWMAAGKQCPVAGSQENISRIHASTHLPGIFDDHQEPTEELIRRRISALRILESLLLGSVANMMGLVTFVNQLRQSHRGEYQVSILQNRAMSEICRLQGHPISDEFVVAPASSPGVLLHWRILLVLFACLSDRDRQGVIDQYPVSATWIDVEGLPEEMDSHFHLDRTRKALNLPNASVEDICASIRPDRDYRFRLVESLFSVISPPTLPGKRCRNSGTKVSPSPSGYIRNMWILMPRQILQPSSSVCRALKSACWGK